MKNNAKSFRRLHTAESVSEGHPDKVADQISDAILDAIMREDKNCRVACEVMVKTGLVFVCGEITTTTWVNIEEIVRETIREIGYISSNAYNTGFDADSCAVITAIGRQSSDISLGVDKFGAGDQGIVYGYATNETEMFIPAPIMYAHKLMQKQASLRKAHILSWLGPDAKSQVTFEYEGDNPVRIHTIVLSTQHALDINHNDVTEAVIENIIKPTIPCNLIDERTKFLINPTGRFVVGGPAADAGLTGRKIIVDSYGGAAHHGGGCFSGKDPTKIDRSAAYMARYIAKNIVVAELATRCEVQLSYAIGIAEPISIDINTFGTCVSSDSELSDFVQKNFDLSPSGIIKKLNLLRPIYKCTAAYGHFGRVTDKEGEVEIINGFTWEAIDDVFSALLHNKIKY